MPTYEYLCEDCKHRFEIVQGIKDDALTDCPECGKPSLTRIIFPVGVVRSSSSRVLHSDDAKAQEEPDRAKLAVSRPEKFDELLARERDAGGRLPVNVSGGSLGCGNLVEAAGLYRAMEVALQLRGHAGRHQIGKVVRRGLALSWRSIPTATGGAVVMEV